MRLALERLTDPLLGWIPDVNDVPRSRQVALGATASVVVHLLLLLLFLGAALVFPAREERAPAAPQPNLEVTVVPMPKPKPQIEAAPKPPSRQFVDANGLKAGERPKEATLESDRDMTEGSELPARGDSPLPTQDGEKLPFMRDFADQDIRLGVDDGAVSAEAARAQAAAAPPQPATATTAPMYDPQPVAKEALAKAEKAQPQEKLPEPARQARATPMPLPKVVNPSDTEIALLSPAQPVATPAPQPMETPQVRPTPNPYANWSTPSPFAGPSVADRYKEELRKTKNEGRISTRGVSGVNAINTPAGRWRRRMFEAMKQNWSLFVRQNPDLITIGTVRVKFTVGKEGGRAGNVLVESDQGNNTSAEISRRAVIETPIPPPPPDLFENLQGEKLEAEVIFTLY